MEHLEDYCDAAIAHLRHTLPGRINLLNGRHDDFEIDQIPDDGDGNGAGGSEFYFGGNTVPIRYPYVEVAAPDDRLATPSLDAQVWRDNARVMIRAWVQHVDFNQLTRSSYRLGQALMETQLQPGAFGEGTYIQDVAAFVRANPETEEADQFTSGILLVMTVVRNVQIG